MCINASPAPEWCFQRLPRLLRRRRNVFKYFSGAGEVLLISFLSGAGEAWEVFKNTFPPPEKCLYTLIWHRRSAYIHLFGAGEAGETGEVFIYTRLKSFNLTHLSHGYLSNNIPRHMTSSIFSFTGHLLLSV